jgi:hypothetical protein
MPHGLNGLAVERDAHGLLLKLATAEDPNEPPDPLTALARWATLS